MDHLDKLIIDIVESEIPEPENYKKSINSALKSKKYKRYKMYNKIASLCMIIMLSTGFVYAGYNIYSYIWEDPKKYNTNEEYMNSLPNDQISDDEKKELISEEESKTIAIDFLNKLGYENKNIERIELKRSYNRANSSYYMVKTKYSYEEGLMVLIDSKTGEVIHFNDLGLKYKHLVQDNLTEDMARKIAEDTYKKLKLPESKYELFDIKQEKSIFENNTRTLWGVIFRQKENGIYNKYKNFSIAFLVVNGEVLYDTINISNNSEEITNPIIVEEKEAIEIALNKEKEFTDVEISNYKAELSIEKMNTFVYQLENEIYNTDINNGGTYLDIKDVTRNVWKITIEHNNKKAENLYVDYNEYIKENYNKEFYVDATTGEILGGNTCEGFNKK